MSTAEPVLVARDLAKSYLATRALEGLSLEVRPGELYGLVGPDGAGKTTAMRIMAGMIAPSAGTARIIGRDPLGTDREVRGALGYMPQQYSLYGDLTVGENLDFFARMFCLERSSYEPRKSRLLEITRLARFIDRRADALSGGMYKKLALACALLPTPRLLLLDEPTNGVDPVSRRELWALLFELAAEGMAIVVSTPYMDEAARCGRVGLIHRGRLLLEGPPTTLIQGLEHPVFSVSGGDRAALDDAFAVHDAVLASSAAGESLRVVIRRGREGELATLVRDHGATARPIAADFEDLFLAITGEAQA